MNKPVDFRELACHECRSAGLLGFDFSMAFQPIVCLRDQRIFGYEALVRGLNGEPAGTIIYHPELCIRTTLAAARENDFPVERILFEITEVERVVDHDHLVNILRHYQQQGFITALDDYGDGYAGLNLLAKVQPDIVKLDMGLVRGIELDPKRQIIVRSTHTMLQELGCRTLAEGVETEAEFKFLRDLGIDLFQGYYFARPAFEALPEVDFSNLN